MRKPLAAMPGKRDMGAKRGLGLGDEKTLGTWKT